MNSNEMQILEVRSIQEAFLRKSDLSLEGM
jgi:hypothetical protein